MCTHNQMRKPGVSVISEMVYRHPVQTLQDNSQDILWNVNDKAQTVFAHEDQWSPGKNFAAKKITHLIGKQKALSTAYTDERGLIKNSFAREMENSTRVQPQALCQSLGNELACKLHCGSSSPGFSIPVLMIKMENREKSVTCEEKESVRKKKAGF